MVLTAYDQGSKKSKILISGNYHDNYPLQVYLQLKKKHFCTTDIMKGKKSKSFAVSVIIIDIQFVGDNNNLLINNYQDELSLIDNSFEPCL